MKPEEIIKLGEKVEVEILEKGEYEGHYLSRIEDIENGRIHIGLPMEKGHIIPLRVGASININLVKKDGVYTFGGLVLTRYLKPYANFVLEYPKKIHRLQRRNYVRITINAAVLFSIIEDKPKNEPKDKVEEPIKIEKAVSLNLSGGGLFFICLKDMPIGTKLKTTVVLPNSTQLKDIISEIKRKDFIGEKGKEKFNYGVEFIEINEKTRDYIISYLFELQRERKIKGLEV